MLSFTKVDPLDMEAYKEWIQRLHNEWPISEEMLFTGRIKKKKVIDIHYKHSYNSKYSNYNYLNYKHYIIKEGDE